MHGSSEITPNSPRRMFVLIGIFIFAVFGHLALKERESLLMAWASRHWRPVTGTITAIADGSFSIDSASQYTTASRTKYPEDMLTVTYKIDGHMFITTNYSFGGHCDQPFALHRVGDHLTVYYDPKDHRRAVIRKGVPVSLLLCPLLCLLGAVWTIMRLFD